MKIGVDENGDILLEVVYSGNRIVNKLGAKNNNLKEVNFKEILKANTPAPEAGTLNLLNELDNIIMNSMKEACRQVLELAAENADVEEFYRGKSYRIDNAFYDSDDSKVVTNKKSITDTINQVKIS